MPLQEDDQIQDMASSDMSTDDAIKHDVAEQAAAGEDASAGSSSATGEPDGSDLLNVVRDVVDKKEADTKQAASPAGSEEGSDQSASDEDDDYSDVPFNNHPRFKQLVSERQEFRKEARAFKREAETFKAQAEVHEQDAVRYRNVQGFIRNNGLTDDEAADLIVVGALAKTNPVDAWARVKPWVQQLLIAAGEVLPDDLQQRVQAGELTPEAAMEISRSKAAVQSFHAAQSFREQLEASRQQEEVAKAMTGAAENWEADRRAKDPNFDAKMTAIVKEVAYLQRAEGMPKSPQGVRAQLDKAYKAVNASFAAVTAPQAKPQPKQAIRPITGGQVAGNQQPAARSTLDIIEARMARRG